ncbi:YIP1 family protein [Anaerotalea alkaliphila]|uniref:YIP1 family protein n=1 Tax=Anaerotalea alkaliphila TaxID=2662126 RepID=A0A7X5HUR6_9FIRM|nr:YIP1 family protein [Anaerotalea alkaliphila]NDL67048.1 YIP1 family protein [Anaerotalea alkaliphila]
MGAWRKLRGTIFSPSEAFEAIREKPTFLLPMLVVPLFPVLYFLVFWDSYQVQVIRMLETQFANMGMELTREMLDAQLRVTRILTPIGALVGPVIGTLAGATYHFLAARIAKSKVTYRQLFSLIFHVQVVGVLLWVLFMVLTLLQGQVSIQEPVTSLASLLPEELYGTALYGAALSVEVFSIWQLCLLYMGLRIVARLSKRASLLIVLSYFVLGALISTGAILFSTRMGNL